MTNIKIVLLVFLLCLIGCVDESTSPKIKHAITPKFHKGQIVYILGETPGYICDTPVYADPNFKYKLEICSPSGGRNTAEWNEDRLTNDKINSNVLLSNRDTTYEQIIVRVNTLSDQKQWVEAEFIPLTLVKTRFCQSVYDDRQHGIVYTAEDVSNVLDYFIEAIDSVKKTLAEDLKAGRYPKQ